VLAADEVSAGPRASSAPPDVVDDATPKALALRVLALLVAL
jgi:hypothetical protein